MKVILPIQQVVEQSENNFRSDRIGGWRGDQRQSDHDRGFGEFRNKRMAVNVAVFVAMAMAVSMAVTAAVTVADGITVAVTLARALSVAVV